MQHKNIQASQNNKLLKIFAVSIIDKSLTECNKNDLET